MAVILNIETASKYCSIAVLAEDKIFYEKKSSVGQSHSSILGIFVKDALEKLKICEKSLDAVAVSSGPGSYTGLRIGASLAKGLCFGLSIPLIAVPTLKILAAAGLNALKTDENRNSLIVCPMLDARRMEVYSALYDADLNEIRPAMAEIIDEKSYTCLVQGDSRLRGKQRSAVANDNPMFFFGDGSTKCKGVISLPNAIFLDGIEPSATAMAKLSEEAYRAGNFVDVAYFEPFYLKDFMATVPRNKVLSAK